MKLKSLILIVGLMTLLVVISTEARKRRGGAAPAPAPAPGQSTKTGPERREEVRQRFRDQNKFIQFKSRKEAGEAARRDGGGKLFFPKTFSKTRFSKIQNINCNEDYKLCLTILIDCFCFLLFLIYLCLQGNQNLILHTNPVKNRMLTQWLEMEREPIINTTNFQNARGKE